jgi:all-trans-retinol 13,14-reductase
MFYIILILLLLTLMIYSYFTQRPDDSNIFLIPDNKPDNKPEKKINIRRKFRGLSEIQQKKFEIVVVGGGVSGLATAAILSRLNWKVLVLEQNEVVGGGLHTFKVGKQQFASGLHYIGNDQESLDIIDFACNEVMNFREMKPFYDVIKIGENESINLSAGKKAWRTEMLRHFPLHVTDIDKYLEVIEKCKDIQVRLFFKLKAISLPFWVIRILQRILCWKVCALSKYSISEFIDRMNIKNMELIAALCGQMGDHGEQPDEGSFLIHAMVQNHYMNGAVMINPDSIVNALVKQIESVGGQVLCQAKITDYTENSRGLESLTVNDTYKICCSKFCLSVPIEKNTQRKTSYQLLSLFLEIKPFEGSHQHNYWYYPSKNFNQDDETLNSSKNGVDIVDRSLFIGFDQDKLDGEKGNVMTVLFTCKPHWYEKFKHLTVGERENDDNYQSWKREISDTVLRQVKRLYIGLEIISVNTASPLSTRTYLGFLNSYGMHLKPSRWQDPQTMPRHPSWKNVFITGQDIITVGISAAFFAAELTANVIVGIGKDIRNFIHNDDLVKKIKNHECKQ